MADDGITVEIRGNQYKVNGYQWFAVNGKPLITKATVKALNNLRDLFGPSGSDPDPDLTLATEAEKQLGAKIIKRTGPTPADSFKANQVY